MTINEFRAWLDGFTAAIGDAPTPGQWAKVQEKLAQVREPFQAIPNIVGPQLPGTPYDLRPTRIWTGTPMLDPSRTSIGSLNFPHDPPICATN